MGGILWIIDMTSGFHWSDVGIVTKRVFKLYEDIFIFEPMLFGCFSHVDNVLICINVIYTSRNICIFFQIAILCLFLSCTYFLSLELLVMLGEKWEIYTICYIMLPAWQFCQLCDLQSCTHSDFFRSHIEPYLPLIFDTKTK